MGLDLAGTHADETVAVMTSDSQCITCAAGSFCSVGSVTSTKCAPGTSNPNVGKSECDPCTPGTFQDGAGATSCKPCTSGNYCPAGASAPLPCPAGTHQNLTMSVMTSVTDCVICPAGTSCFVGSTKPTPCSPGFFNPTAQQQQCRMRDKHIYNII